MPIQFAEGRSGSESVDRWLSALLARTDHARQGYTSVIGGLYAHELEDFVDWIAADIPGRLGQVIQVALESSASLATVVLGAREDDIDEREGMRVVIDVLREQLGGSAAPGA